jgi:hypothetical protein
MTDRAVTAADIAEAEHARMVRMDLERNSLQRAALAAADERHAELVAKHHATVQHDTVADQIVQDAVDNVVDAIAALISEAIAKPAKWHCTHRRHFATFDVAYTYPQFTARPPGSNVTIYQTMFVHSLLFRLAEKFAAPGRQVHIPSNERQFEVMVLCTNPLVATHAPGQGAGGLAAAAFGPADEK